ncbi:MAG: hypothetical protein ACTID1_00240 [Pseudolactococcus laudensis]
MNIYKLSQTINDDYETYDSCIVIAENEEEAIKIHPNGRQNWDTRGRKLENSYFVYENFDIDDWVEIEDIKVELIGIADRSLNGDIEVVCASFNAG